MQNTVFLKFLKCFTFSLQISRAPSFQFSIGEMTLEWHKISVEFFCSNRTLRMRQTMFWRPAIFSSDWQLVSISICGFVNKDVLCSFTKQASLFWKSDASHPTKMWACFSVLANSEKDLVPKGVLWFHLNTFYKPFYVLWVFMLTLH